MMSWTRWTTGILMFLSCGMRVAGGRLRSWAGQCSGDGEPWMSSALMRTCSRTSSSSLQTGTHRTRTTTARTLPISCRRRTSCSKRRGSRSFLAHRSASRSSCLPSCTTSGTTGCPTTSTRTPCRSARCASTTKAFKRTTTRRTSSRRSAPTNRSIFFRICPRRSSRCTAPCSLRCCCSPTCPSTSPPSTTSGAFWKQTGGTLRPGQTTP
mmetsp:Transcript_53528/g.130806  ORF Transcript_53528/g.130806 Transcript_53528/m.130806 type:complete len:210 (+) Transcript_53528:991-1620(+)